MKRKMMIILRIHHQLRISGLEGPKDRQPRACTLPLCLNLYFMLWCCPPEAIFSPFLFSSLQSATWFPHCRSPSAAVCFTFSWFVVLNLSLLNPFSRGRGWVWVRWSVFFAFFGGPQKLWWKHVTRGALILQLHVHRIVFQLDHSRGLVFIQNKTAHVFLSAYLIVSLDLRLGLVFGLFFATCCVFVKTVVQSNGKSCGSSTTNYIKLKVIDYKRGCA